MIYRTTPGPAPAASPAADRLATAAARTRDETARTLRRQLRELERHLPWASRVGPSPPHGETPASYALLHHAVYEINRACDDRDVLRLREAFAVASSADQVVADGTGAAPLPVVDAARCRATADPRFGSRVYAVTPGALDAADAVPGALLDGAIRVVSEAGLLGYVIDGVGVLVLRDRLDGESSAAFSYTLGAFPHTVFTDWSGDAILLGESLVHEGAHSWLNAALGAEGETLPREPLAYSPWKRTKRPAFGLIHAAMAFSLLTSYFGAAKRNPDASAARRRYCEVREDVERRRVAMARDGIEEALGHVRSDDIVEVVRAAMAAATQSDLAVAR